MTNILNYNRQQALKAWEPMQPIQLPTKLIQYYNHKIHNIHDIKECDSFTTPYLIELEGYQQQIDANYVKYVALKYINNLIKYIESKGIVLEDIELNIRQILNEITNNTVDEDYYLNTIEIYNSISGNNYNDEDIYDVINQAIRLDNKRLLYYIIFKEDEDMADRVNEVISE